MDNKLEKEYKISAEIFIEGYKAFQKKYVYPKNWAFAVIFLLLTADFVYAAAKDPSNYFAYILSVTCLALAIREFVNPGRIRRRFAETIKGMSEVIYKIAVADGFVDISTVSEPVLDNDDNSGGENDDGEEAYALPEPTHIPLDSDFRLQEHDRFFLLFYGKSVFYIVPKDNFSESELDIMRSLDKK